MKPKRRHFIYTGASMSPTLQDGDLLLCHTETPDNIRRGDVVVFFHPDHDRSIVHRVISRVSGGFLTQGDGARQSDAWVTHPDRIIGVCRFIRRRNREMRIWSGLAGILVARYLQPWRKRLVNGLRPVFRPAYHLFCKTRLWRSLTPYLAKPYVVSFQRVTGIEWKLFWGKKEIGRLPPGASSWQIRKPYLLIVNEAALPRRETP